MANGHYHVHVRNFSASRGHNPVEKGAYRAGLDIEDPLTGHMKAYAWKTEKDQIETEMVLPEAAGENSKFKEPTYFFQEIRKKEKAKNARYFKEAEISLNRNLPPEENKKLAREFASRITEKYNVPANLSFHNPKGKENPHFHLSIAMRGIEGDQFKGNKNRELDKKGFVKEVRELWTELSNEKFKELGIDMSIDDRSNKARGIETEPQLHINKKSVLDQQHEKDKQEYNKIIKKNNKKLEMQLDRKQRKKEIKESILIRKITRKEVKQEMAETQQQQTKAPEIGNKNTVYKLYDNEVSTLKQKYQNSKNSHLAQREKNKENKKAYHQQRLNHKERMGQSKGIVSLKKNDITEMKFKHKELKANLKSFAIYDPAQWQQRREIKKQMTKNKIQQKRKKLEVKKEKAKQKMYKKKFNEKKQEFKKEKRKELGLYKEKTKCMLQIGMLNREKQKVKNMQIPGNVVSLKDYKEKFKVEKTKEHEQEKERAL